MGFREKIIIFGVVPWVVTIALLILLVIPTISAVFENFATLGQKEVELADLKQSVESKKNTQKIDDTIAQLEESLLGFNKEFPSKDDLEALYVDLQTALNDTDLKLDKLAVSKEKSIKFPKTLFEDDSDDGDKKSKKKKKKKKRSKKTAPPAKVVQRSFKLDIIGDYQNTIDLLVYLNNYYRFITLETISVKKPRMKGANLDSLATLNASILEVTVIFSVYSYIQAEKPEEDKKKDTKTKKK